MSSTDTNSDLALTLNGSKKRTRQPWSPDEAQFVLNCFDSFKDEIGREKAFKTQKALCEWIAVEMAKTLNSTKTGYQVGQHFQNLNKKSAGKEKIVKDQQESVIARPAMGSVINVEQASVISTPIISVIDIQANNNAQSHVDEVNEDEEPFIITISPPLNNRNSANEFIQNGGQSNIPVSNFGFQGLDIPSRSNDFPRFGVPPRASNIGVATVYGIPSNRAMSVNITDSRILSPSNTAPVRFGSSLNSAATTRLASFTSEPISSNASSNSRSVLSNSATVSPASASTSVRWTVDETKCLLDEYYCYMDEVGPQKLFRTKKALWDTLARKLNAIFETNKTGGDLEERVKELIEKKKVAVNHNRVSGQTRMLIEYEEELSRISNLDDSIEPEVLRGVKHVQYKKPSTDKRKSADVGGPSNKSKTTKPRWDRPNKKLILNTLTETMKSIEQRRVEREVAREERRSEKHDQVMEILRALKKE